MKNSGLILLGGLLFISLSQESDSKETRQNSYAATYYSQDATCQQHQPSANLASSNALAAQTTIDLQEQVEDQKVVLTTRLLQLVDAFAELVMVI
ncbi:hypothetical protein [Pontibacter sp. HSC-36F09]|uniref:hypothetical protein n=1 Tax=Pontibacter sp. HSC-36F09 TaxID=2910966 RepID=UPI00209D89E6|nr:hypothetical protein [Pontibacter sp. HSC-36F09]MCP2043844.1 hypothetical protein [Pontibacter sp. HSC-36F09]